MADQDIRVEISGANADLRRAARESIRDIRNVGQEARKQTILSRGVEAQNDRTAASFGRVDVRARGYAQSLRDVGVSARALGIATAIVNVGPLTAGVGDLAAAGLAAGTALAPLAGTVASLPSLFGAAGQGIFVGKLAFNQLEKAIQGDADALAALDPLQRRLVEQIKGDLAPEIQRLQLIAQEGLLPGVSEFLGEVIDSAPMVRRVLGDTADEMGGVVEKAADLYGREGVQRDIERFGHTNAEVLGDLGDAAISFGDGMRHVVAAADPLTRHLSNLTRKGGELFADWARDARRSGDLADFFDLTQTRVDQSLHIVGNFADVLGDLHSGARPLADGLMEGLVDETAKLAEITGSPQGQANMREFFEGAKEPLQETGKLARDLVVDLADLGVDSQDNLADLARTLRTDILPPLSDIAHTITEDAMPSVIDLAGEIGNLVDEADEGLGGVADGVSALADGLGFVVDITADITGNLHGIGKLVPTIALGAGTIAGWRRLRGLTGDLLSGRGGKGGALPGIAGEFLERGTPTNPMWVAVVNGGAGPGGLPGGGKAERRSPGGVILPPGVDDPRTPSPRTRAGRLGNAVRGGLRGAGAVGRGFLRGGPLTATWLTAETFQAAAGNGMSTLAGGAHLIEEIERSSGKATRKIQEVDRAIAHLRQEAKKPGESILDPKFGKAIQDLERYKGRLVETEKVLAPLRSRFRDLVDQKDTKGLAQLADGARFIASEFPDASSALLRFAERVDDTAQRSVKPQFRAMRDAADGSLSDIRRTVDSNSRIIRQKLGSESQAGKDALAKNFMLAAQAVDSQMDRAGHATQEGLELIDRLMGKALEQYGLSKEQARNVVKTGGEINGSRAGTGNEGGAGLKYNARGGLHDLGSPSARGYDDVPLLLNGQPVMAAEGESVAVLNRHQRAGLDQLARAGGYRGLRDYIATNDRPHYMSSGGIIEAAGGYAIGDGQRHGSWPMLSGDLDFSVQLGNALQALAQAAHHSIYVQDGGRTLADQQQRVRDHGLYDPVTNPTGAAAPDPNAPHVRGIAADITPGVDVFGGLAGRFGLAFPMSSEPWHIQLIGDAAAGISGGGGAPLVIDIPELKRVMFPEGMGALSAIGQAGLDAVRAAAQRSLEEALTGAHVGSGSLSEQEIERLLAIVGLPPIFEDISYAESRWNPNAHNASGASGLLQIMMPLHAALVARAARMVHRPNDVFDPLVNVMTGKLLYDIDGLNPWAASKGMWAQAGTYGASGLLLDGPLLAYAASGHLTGLDDITSLGDPKAPDPTPAKSTSSKSKSKSKSKAKKDKGPKRYDTPQRPNLAKIHGKVPKRHKPVIPKWILDSEISDGDPPVLIPDLDRLYERPITFLRAQLQNLAGEFDLTDEQQTVELYDSAQHADLTNYLNAHPDLLAGKTVAEWMDENGESLTVDNPAGMTVQGRFVPGRQQHIDEVMQLLGIHERDGTGLLPMLTRYLDETNAGVPTFDKRILELRWGKSVLRRAWNARKKVLDRDVKERDELYDKGRSWQERVADNNERIDTLEEFLRDVRIGSAGNKKLSPRAEKNVAWARNRIAELREENTDLEFRKPPGQLNKPEPPSKPGPKASPQARERYQEQLAAYEDDMRAYHQEVAARARKLSRLGEEIRDSRATLRFIGDSTDSLSDNAGAIGRYTTQIEHYRGERQTLRDTRDDLVISQIPEEQQQIRLLRKEVESWSVDPVAFKPLPRVRAEDDESGRDSEMASLLREQLEETRRALAISQAQTRVFAEFAPLAGQRLLGSYLHGTDYVPKTGPYLLHEGERVVTNPDGPFGNSLVPAPVAGVPAQPVVNVYIEGDAAPFIGRVRAEIDSRASQVVSRQLGRRARVITAAPGG